ncbi:MAG TPA: Arc family DNA-binding protein [Candidatus Agathobaculum merdipullorum]|nr:Arc family DNA-binding protein [uncultured Agathobaculum sp.]HIY12413.1 Arc family DNA-binding protein [Candidatus Agathobaculum merdipullorum]
MGESKHIGFRVDEETLEKLRYVASYEGRSINGHLMYLAREDIRRFEKEHGKIERGEGK